MKVGNILCKNGRSLAALLMLTKQMEENRTTKELMVVWLFKIYFYFFIFVLVIFHVNFCLVYCLRAYTGLAGITFTDPDTW